MWCFQNPFSSVLDVPKLFYTDCYTVGPTHNASSTNAHYVCNATLYVQLKYNQANSEHYWL